MATQDLLLVAKALILWAGQSSHETPCACRAWELVAEIAAELGFSPEELVTEIDPEWYVSD